MYFISFTHLHMWHQCESCMCCDVVKMTYSDQVFLHLNTAVIGNM